MRGKVHLSALSAWSFIWLRAGLLVAGVIAGLWLSFTPATGLYRVRARTRADLLRMQADAPAPATQISAAPLPAILGDQAWQDLAKQLSETTAGTSKLLLPNLDTRLGENDYYFPLDRPPLKQLAHSRQKGTEPVYVQVAPAGHPGYLEVTYLAHGASVRHAPTDLAYPLRQYAVWCFVVGAAGFGLLPHRYYRWRSLRAAEVTVAVVVSGGLICIWLLAEDMPRPLERLHETSPEVVARKERIVKELAPLQQQMREALAEIERTPLAQRKSKLDAYRALMARYTQLSEAFTQDDTGGAAVPATQPAP